MHLKSLTLKGFKSFASATTLKFEPGICAVVGPNGSGKSNVVDALAWVMGEQGAKTLRGGSMQDVIFAGTGDRKPLGRAEVTLTIDNSDGKLPIDYSEVSVTRRMFRDGASEYEINGSRARLMDIQELLSDSGIGREMHVIVGQGRLAQILESRPEERRAYIEEAAGVLKHRRRKEKAQRKLVGMQGNLDRLTDLTEELGRQLTPLARQAEAAKRAATVQAELREARLVLAADQLRNLRLKVQDAVAEQNRAKNLVAETQTEVEECAGEELGLEQALSVATPEAKQAQELWFQLSTLAERVNATLRVARDRANASLPSELTPSGPDPDDLLARAEAAEEEFEALRETCEIARERLETISEEVAEKEEAAREAEAQHMAEVRALADAREGVVRLVAQEEAQRTRLADTQAEVQRLEEFLGQALQASEEAEGEALSLETQLDALEQERPPLLEAQDNAAKEAQAAEDRLEELRGLQRGHEREVYTLSSRIDTLANSVPKNPETSAQALASQGDFSELARHLHIDKRLARALGAALGEHAAAMVGQPTSLQALVADLSHATRTVVVVPLEGDSWRLDAVLPDNTSWLLDHLKLEAPISATINRLLVDVVLVEDAESARAVIESDPRLRAVTPGGVLYGQGWVAVGEGQSSRAVEVSADIEAAREELTLAQAKLQELSGTLEGAHLSAQQARVHAAAATAALKECDTRIDSVRREAERARKQAQTQRQEHTAAATRLGAVEERLAEAQRTLDATTHQLAHLDDTDEMAEPSTEARDEAVATLAQIRAMEMEARLAARSAEEKVQAAAGKAPALRRQAQAEQMNRARQAQALAARHQRVERACTIAELGERIAGRLSDATAAAITRRDETAATQQVLIAKLGKLRERANTARTRLQHLSEKAHAAELAASRAQVRLEEAETSLSEQLGIGIGELNEYPLPEDFSRPQWTTRLREAEKNLASLGKVNPLALEEFKALEERHKFLSTQLDDVIRARRDLEGVIEEVDERILQLFSDAWADVEAEFPKVFHTLFPGGEGRLILTNPEDMLTTGIEVEARPPGKKVKRLSLLSGGEKSLTALAMLVAIFRARPSPFYVMDEVEAALDDVNLRRLIALFEELREDSQLIVITHQKPTMDVANVLYGVTMRGDGITRVISQRMSPPSSPEPEPTKT
ncbi:chromosome segregation protein SMC [Corynebacterium spheniscorum]|uniref:Chromosome partition protein Smc n=1 Tax=Corynebacterium spheniscorum TaxID=185761 RepID=A0A1I2R9W5_9CORY|nr:chromosome segregation protein SMC [Corynebacterium spheniscorum]KAA8722601.1 chromosome segregation protein SMC [Corynebacterium spheniscorum]SFG37328.1 condensin subunit Smc [Corynebacterium spheniscorum]